MRSHLLIANLSVCTTDQEVVSCVHSLILMTIFFECLRGTTCWEKSHEEESLQFCEAVVSEEEALEQLKEQKVPHQDQAGCQRGDWLLNAFSKWESLKFTWQEQFSLEEI